MSTEGGIGGLGTVIQPSSGTEDNPPKYTFNNATTTNSGHSFEMDDTPGNERIRIQHRGGSYSEYQATGNVVHKIWGNGFEFIVKDKAVVVQGDCYITVMGNANLKVEKDAIVSVGQDLKMMTTGRTTIYSDTDMDITASGDLNITADSITLSATNSVDVNANLNVRSDILCAQSITATGNLNAGMNVYGTLSLQTPGYLLVGGAGAVGGLMAVGGAAIVGGTVTSTDFIAAETLTTFTTHVHSDPQGGVVGPPEPP